MYRCSMSLYLWGLVHLLLLQCSAIVVQLFFGGWVGKISGFYSVASGPFAYNTFHCNWPCPIFACHFRPQTIPYITTMRWTANKQPGRELHRRSAGPVLVGKRRRRTNLQRSAQKIAPNHPNEGTEKSRLQLTGTGWLTPHFSRASVKYLEIRGALKDGWWYVCQYVWMMRIQYYRIMGMLSSLRPLLKDKLIT